MWLVIWSGTGLAANLLVGPNRTIQTLQEAVDTAADGDRILVDAGAYDGFSVVGRSLTVQARAPGTVWISDSLGGTLVSVEEGGLAMIDLSLEGDGSKRGVEVVDGDLYMRNVTVENAASTGPGAAVHAVESTVRIEASMLLGNSASGDGGHAYFFESDVEIDGSQFELGSALGFGGALAAVETVLVIRGTTFRENRVDGPNTAFGAGVFVQGGSTRVQASRFESNQCAALPECFGGGLWSDGVILDLWDSRFEENEASSGGALGVLGGNGTIWRVVAENNGIPTGANLDGVGGGAYLSNVDLEVADSWFEGNRSTVGAGVYADISDVSFLRNVLCDNEAAERAAGLDGDSTNFVMEGNVFLANDNNGALGGALFLDRPGGTLDNNTVVANTSGGMGSGLALRFSVPPIPFTTRSNIFVENLSPGPFYGESDGWGAGDSLFSEYDVFFDNSASMYAQTMDMAVGLSTVDPGFSLPGACDISGLGTVGSPVVGLGHPNRVDISGGQSTPGAFGGPNPSRWLDDADGDGRNDALDCDSTSPDVFVGAAEICDGLDNDCDGLVDEVDPNLVASYAFPDVDGDGAGDAFGGRPVCATPAGWLSTSGDCDDADAAVQGGLWRVDMDGDGFGAGAVVTSCAEVVPGNYVAASLAEDCDDTLLEISPGAPEICDGLDNDCDGAVDQDDDSLDTTSLQTVYDDTDGDGLGDVSTAMEACVVGPDQADVPGDCDDTDSSIMGPVLGFEDFDEDGFGTVSITACPGPDVADVDGDCDDTEPTVYPSAPELCDGLDNDCDGLLDLDDGDAMTQTWYPDVDQDGFGTTDGVEACEGPMGHVIQSGDCDDEDPNIYPGAPEVPDDGIDADCDGLQEEVVRPDTDGDGVVDAIDNSPSDGDVTSTERPEPAYGCGCATSSPLRTWTWVRRRN